MKSEKKCNQRWKKGRKVMTQLFKRYGHLSREKALN